MGKKVRLILICIAMFVFGIATTLGVVLFASSRYNTSDTEVIAEAPIETEETETDKTKTKPTESAKPAVTTKPAETVAPTVAPKPAKTTAAITYDSVIEYDDLTLFDFEKIRSVGSTVNVGDTVQYEGFAGTTSGISGNTLKFSYYNHAAAISKTSDISIFKYGYDKAIATFKSVDINYQKYDISELENGLYYLLANVSTTGAANTTKQYFYVNGDDSYLCSVTTYSSVAGMTKQRNAWKKLTDDLDIEAAKDFDIMTYPTSGDLGHVSHTQQWADFSKTLIKGDNWSDEAKVFAFAYWIANNVAYDSYKVDTLVVSRAKVASTSTYDGYCYDKYFAYYTKVGVCWDYTNILAIMCRANGIPCTSVESDYHTFNAVYLYGHWVPIDITMFYRYECRNSDVSPEKWTEQSQNLRAMTRGFGEYSNAYTMKTTGTQIWTQWNATNPDNQSEAVKNIQKNQ